MVDDRIQRVFELWVDITGVDPSSNKIRFKDYDVYSANKEIEEALNFDDEGITALLLMDYFTEEYLINKNFSAMSLITDFENTKKYLSKCKELLDILHSDDLESIRANYKTNLLNIVDKMEIYREDVTNMINDKHAIAFLVRDAFKSFRNLNRYQFSFGKSNSTQMKFIQDVYAFWNVNSMVRLIKNSVDYGVALAMIKDEEEAFSYFGFVVKNGENLVFLTDKADFKHPMQKFMTRRAGRMLEERAYKNHFPYDLLSVTLDGVPKKTTELIQYNTELAPIKKLTQLHPDEIIWNILMFALIEQKYFKEQNFEKEQIYLGDSIQTANMTTLPAVIDTPILTIPEIKSEDVTAEATAHIWERKSPQINKWVEERYEVDESNYNLIGSSALLLPGAGVSSSDKSALQIFDPTSFGTEESIKNYRLWLARYNKAIMLQEKLEDEFKRDRKEIEEWFKAAVTKNADKLLEYIVKGECMETYMGCDIFESEQRERQTNILDIRDESHYKYTLVRLSHFEKGKDHCWFTKGPTSYYADFSPQSAEGIKLLTGEDNIPEILTHWNLHQQYIGNPILDCLDPMDWKVRNPWLEVRFNIRMCVSKRAYNEKRKQLNLAPKNEK